jgi:hypothetical protein
MIIQLANKNDFNTLKKFLKDKNIKLGGLFRISQIKYRKFPSYYVVSEGFHYKSWGSVDTNYPESVNYYNQGAPIEAILYPEKYPEYYI